MSDAPAVPANENGVPPVTQQKIDELPGFKVFAGNLAYSTTDDGLKAFFAPVQRDILSAQVILRGTRSAGYGFVALYTEAAAQKAVELLHKTELDGRPVIVEIAKPADQKEKKEKKPKGRMGRRGSRAPLGEVTEAEANGEVEKVEEAAPATDEAAKPKKKRKFGKKVKKVPAGEDEAAPTATTNGDAAPAAEGEDKEKKPRARKPKVQRPRRPAGEDPVGERSTNMLFVANLGFAVDDAALEKVFTDVGITVNSARIVRRRWGNPRRSKGYGFVDVGDEAAQQKAIAALQGKEFDGRPIAVKVAVNTQVAETEGANAA